MVRYRAASGKATSALIGKQAAGGEPECALGSHQNVIELRVPRDFAPAKMALLADCPVRSGRVATAVSLLPLQLCADFGKLLGRWKR